MSTINVEMGTCRATWGTMVPFQTKGGIEVSYAPEYHEVILDMYGKAAIDQILIGEVMKAKVPIAETNYNNLKVAMPASTEVTDASGNKKLTIGKLPGWKLSSIAQPLTMHPVTYDDAVKNFDITLHKAVPVGEIKFLYEFDKERIYEVTFIGLVDTDRQPGDYIAAIGDATIVADTTIPVVTTAVPANGSISASKTAPLTWLMGSAINSDTVTPAHVSVFKTSDGSAVAGTVAYNQTTKTISFTPSVALTGATAYTAMLTTGIKGSNGVSLAGASVTNFTTVA